MNFNNDAEIKLNKYGVNLKIKAHILDDVIMRKIGFTDFSKDRWYFFKDMGNEISFNVSINKNDIEDLQVDILDENFCQPYDYQYILEHNPTQKVALKIKEKVEHWMKYLQDNGVLSGHVYGEYI